MQSGWLGKIERLPIATQRPWIGYAVAILACWVAVVVRWVVGGPLIAGYPFITFVPAVVLTAFFFGPRPGIFAGVLSWFAARYYFIMPVHSFVLTPPVIASIPFYAAIVAVDIAIIHFMQRANHELREQRETSLKHTELREIMFSELQHRVSNKLQIVASLLTLQKRRVIDPDAQKALEDAALRVGMIGRISRALHDPERGGLGVGAFIEQVGRDIVETAGAHDVRLIVHAEPDAELSDDSGVPIALIVAETISNALEHGFQSRGAGEIRIDVRRVGESELLLTIADDGVGIAPGFDSATSSSLGLKIANTLARQLKGSFALRPGQHGGTVAELRVGA